MDDKNYLRIDAILVRRENLARTRIYLNEEVNNAREKLRDAESGVRSVEEEDARLAQEYSELMGWNETIRLMDPLNPGERWDYNYLSGLCESGLEAELTEAQHIRWDELNKKLKGV